MRNFEEFCARKRREYGEKFDPSELAMQFAPYLHTRQRVRVANTAYDHVRTGTVGVTTGWRPAFLLMARNNAHGSSDVLCAQDTIVAIQRGRAYVNVTR